VGDRVAQPVHAARALGLEPSAAGLARRAGTVTVEQAAAEVVSRAARLAAAFRERARPVALVRVAFSPDGGDVLRTRTDAQPPPMDIGPDFATLRDELGRSPDDLLIAKRGWDAFNGTELDLQLRRREIRSLVLGGIRTCISVESTARHAHGLGYELVDASDAVTDLDADLHRNSVEGIFPRLARVDTTDAIVAASARAWAAVAAGPACVRGGRAVRSTAASKAWVRTGAARVSRLPNVVRRPGQWSAHDVRGVMGPQRREAPRCSARLRR